MAKGHKLGHGIFEFFEIDTKIVQFEASWP